MNRCSHPMTQGNKAAFVMARSMTTLVFWYLIGTLILVVSFAALYAWTGCVADGDGVKQSFWACIYFSITTHATVGYGDLTPTGVSGRSLMGLQAILATVYNVLFLGVIVAKAIWPPQSIIISPIAVFDPVEQKFRFRFYNAHKLPLCDTSYTLSFRGVGSSGSQLLYRNFRIAMQYPGHPIIESGRPWVVNTMPCNGTGCATHERLDAAKENLLCPVHLKLNSYLTLQIQGKYPGLGGQGCLAVERILVENIRCGRLALIETIDEGGVVESIDWKNFDKCTPVTITDCKVCQRQPHCFLANRIIGEK